MEFQPCVLMGNITMVFLADRKNFENLEMAIKALKNKVLGSAVVFNGDPSIPIDVWRRLKDALKEQTSWVGVRDPRTKMILILRSNVSQVKTGQITGPLKIAGE